MTVVKRELANFFTKILWPSYLRDGGNEHSAKILIKHWLLQKVMRINAHVPWPVHPTSKIVRPDKISRGTRTPGLAHSCHIDGRNGVVFGENVWVGPRVSIISMNHNLNDFNSYESCRPVVIGSDCWLATNSVILPGVELGAHTIVAAGAVVNQSFLEGDQVIAGVPAKVVKKIGKYGA